MHPLEKQRGSLVRVAYELTEELPFVLRFAQRRKFADYLVQRGSQSDGATTGHDGGAGGEENFDWLTDD